MIEAAFSAAVPFVLAGLGAMISDRAGVLNISAEGCIGGGAFVAAILSASGVPAPVAAVGAAAAGGIFGMLLAGVHLGLGANLFIGGLGINLLVPSLSGLVSQYLYGHKGILRFDPAAVSWVSWGMIPLAAAVFLGLKYTGWGRRIRAAGTSPDFLVERGVSCAAVQRGALLISSSAAALAGAMITLRIGAYVPGISSGRGWIALVLVWMGFRRPAGVLAAAYLFALLEAASGQLQGLIRGAATMMLALPYAAALLALVLASAGRTRRRP